MENLGIYSIDVSRISCNLKKSGWEEQALPIPKEDISNFEFLPPANEFWGKVIFLHLSVILFTGGCYPSMHCRWYPSMHCSRSRGGLWYPSMPCRFPGPHPRGKLRGIRPGGSPGPHPRGKSRGSGLGGSPDPRPRGKLTGIWQGCLQTHTWGGLQTHTQGVCPGPHLGGHQAHTGGVMSRPRPGWIPGCTEADTPPQQTATAPGGTHPIGMHSCEPVCI